MFDDLRFETFADVRGSILNEYLSFAETRLSKEDGDYKAL